ncbi:hypothetical protein EC950183_4794, partial [Escherichia coli 95.0183]
FLVTSIFYP